MSSTLDNNNNNKTEKNSPNKTARKNKTYNPYFKAPISTQIVSSKIKSDEQLLTDSRCIGYDYVDISYFIGS